VKGLFNPRFLGLTLRYRNAVARTCDQLLWFSLIYIFIDDDIIHTAISRLEHRVIVLLLLAFCLTVLPVRAALSFVFFRKLSWE
jgi:hypothetical protein